MMLPVTEGHMEVEDPVKKEDAMVSMGGYLIGDMRMEFRRGYTNRGGGPPDDGGPLMMEDPQVMEDPLIIEDPQEMEVS